MRTRPAVSPPNRAIIVQDAHSASLRWSGVPEVVPIESAERLKASIGAGRERFFDSPPVYDAVLLKAMLVHGARWGTWADQLLDGRPDLAAIANANSRRVAQKDYLTRWLGYGAADIDHGLGCTAERVTLLGVGELQAEKAFMFSAPLPPTLAGKRAWRRLTVTLAWMSPINCGHQGYLAARLWITQPQDQMRVKRANSVREKAALRGTVSTRCWKAKMPSRL